MKDKKFERQTAYKIKIREILEGQYMKEEGWNPNYIITSRNKKASRVNLMGVVVSNSADPNEKFSSILIDDGSARINVRSFDEKQNLNKYELGEVINIIGKIREYGKERYVASESIKKMHQKEIDIRNAEIKAFEARNYMFMEEAEVKNEPKEETIEATASEENIKTKDNTDSPVDNIINTIKSLDSGEGVTFEKILEKHGKESESTLQKLLENGEIFEIQPGKIKVLE